VFGAFLVLSVLIVMEELIRPRLFRRWRALLAITVAVLGVGVVLSFSRAAWLNLGVGLTVMLLVLALRPGGARRPPRLLTMTLAAGGIAAAAVIAAGSIDSCPSGRPCRFMTSAASRPSERGLSSPSASRWGSVRGSSTPSSPRLPQTPTSGCSANSACWA
jgi:hypothetical protein